MCVIIFAFFDYRCFSQKLERGIQKSGARYVLVVEPDVIIHHSRLPMVRTNHDSHQLQSCRSGPSTDGTKYFRAFCMYV